MRVLAAVGARGRRQHFAPAPRHGGRVVGLQLDAGDRARHVGLHHLAPARTGPAPRVRRIHPVEREDRAADVARVQVQGGGVVELRLPHDAHAEPLHARAVARTVLRLHDHHVAAVAAAALEQATRGGAGAVRRDHLEVGVADRHHRVAQAEHLDARIVERDLDAEHVTERLDGRLELARHQRDLTQTAWAILLRRPASLTPIRPSQGGDPTFHPGTVRRATVGGRPSGSQRRPRSALDPTSMIDRGRAMERGRHPRSPSAALIALTERAARPIDSS